MKQYENLVESAKHPTHNNIYSLVCFLCTCHGNRDRFLGNCILVRNDTLSAGCIIFFNVNFL